MLTVSVPERVEQEKQFPEPGGDKVETVPKRVGSHTLFCAAFGMFLNWGYVNNIANTGP